jgi:hypothetical protein
MEMESPAYHFPKYRATPHHGFITRCCFRLNGAAPVALTDQLAIAGPARPCGQPGVGSGERLGMITAIPGTQAGWSGAGIALGLDIADPLIGLAITVVILRITRHSWQTVRRG